MNSNYHFSVKMLRRSDPAFTWTRIRWLDGILFELTCISDCVYTSDKLPRTPEPVQRGLALTSHHRRGLLTIVLPMILSRADTHVLRPMDSPPYSHSFVGQHSNSHLHTPNDPNLTVPMFINFWNRVCFLKLNDYNIFTNHKLGFNQYPVVVGLIFGNAFVDGSGAAQVKVAEKMTFDVKLEETVFEMRTLMDLGLKDTKDLAIKRTSRGSPTRTD